LLYGKTLHWFPFLIFTESPKFEISFFRAGDRRKKNSAYQPDGREDENRSIKIFRREGEQIRFGKKNFVIINIYVFSGVATAERIRRMHDLKVSHIQIINT
jgi:hypothetical protein